MVFLAIGSVCFASTESPSTDQGILLYQEGRCREAVAELQAVLKGDPQNERALKYLDLALRFLEKTQAALPKPSSPESSQPSLPGQKPKTKEKLEEVDASLRLEEDYIAQKRSRAANSDAPGPSAPASQKNTSQKNIP